MSEHIVDSTVIHPGSTIDASMPEEDDHDCVSKAYRFDDSDFTLVSSDGIQFLVHMFMIRMASVKFLETQNTSTSFTPDSSLPDAAPIKIVYLTKDVIEHSIVVKTFLDILYGNNNIEADEEDTRLYCLVIRFCRAWSCDSVLLKFTKEFKLAIYEEAWHPIMNILVAIELFDQATILLLFSKQRWDTWTRVSLDNTSQLSAKIPKIANHFPVDEDTMSATRLPIQLARLRPGSWNYKHYAQVPLTVIWIILKKMGNYPIGENSMDYAIGEAPWTSIAYDIWTSLDEAYDHYYKPHSDPSRSGDDLREAHQTLDEVRCDHCSTIDDYRDQHSDLVLISSDNVSFSVHSSRMQRASSVLRDMISLARDANQREKLIITDEILEHSLVITSLLDIIYDNKVLPLRQVPRVIYLLRLADKWEIPMISRLILDQLRQAFYESSHHAFDLFRIAVELRDYDLASKLIGVYDQAPNAIDEMPHMLQVGRLPAAQYDQMAPRLLTGFIKVVLDDVYSMPYAAFIALPPKVSWALLRATWFWDPTGRLPPTDMKDARRVSIAATFRHIMDPESYPDYGSTHTALEAPSGVYEPTLYFPPPPSISEEPDLWAVVDDDGSDDEDSDDGADADDSDADDGGGSDTGGSVTNGDDIV